MAARKSLVLGGTRYFGKRLVQKLIDRGDQVTLLSRGETQDPFGTAIDRIQADRTDGAAFKNALRDASWDLVFDQICYSPNEAHDACELFDGKVGRYIYTSTVSVYPGYGVRHEEDVDTLSQSYQLGSREDFNYGDAKRYAECVFFQKAKFSVAAMRIPIVLGPDDYTGRLEFHIDRVKSGRPIYLINPNAKTTFISSSEAAEFLLWLGDQDCRRPLNACSNGAISISEIIEQIEKAVGKRAEIVSKGEDKDHSPFVWKDSSITDNSEASKLGFKFTDLKSWFPQLVKEVSRRTV